MQQFRFAFRADAAVSLKVFDDGVSGEIELVAGGVAGGSRAGQSANSAAAPSRHPPQIPATAGAAAFAEVDLRQFVLVKLQVGHRLQRALARRHRIAARS